MHSFDGIIRTREELDFAIYADDTYNYYCFASPGTALTLARWQILMTNLAGTRGQFCQGTCAFSFQATDLETVQLACGTPTATPTGA